MSEDGQGDVRKERCWAGIHAQEDVPYWRQASRRAPASAAEALSWFAMGLTRALMSKVPSLSVSAILERGRSTRKTRGEREYVGYRWFNQGTLSRGTSEQLNGKGLTPRNHCNQRRCKSEPSLSQIPPSPPRASTLTQYHRSSLVFKRLIKPGRERKDRHAREMTRRMKENRRVHVKNAKKGRPAPESQTAEWKASRTGR